MAGRFEKGVKWYTRGVIPENSIYKTGGVIVNKE